MLKKNLTVRRSSPHNLVLAGRRVAFFASRTVLESEASMSGRCCCVIWVSVGLMTLVLGCGAPSTQPPHLGSPPPNPTPGASLAPLTAATFSQRLAPEQSLALALPEASLWQMRNEGTYTRAAHAETASELWVKRWRQGEVVSAANCEAQSLLWRPELGAPSELHAPSSSTPILHAPADYHTHVDVRIWADGETWRGQLTATGAAIRECFAYVYRTRAPRSALGRAVVEQRLGVMRRALEATRVTSRTTEAPDCSNEQ